MRRILLLCVVAVLAFSTTANAAAAFGFQTARAQVAQVLTLSVTPPVVDFGIYTAGFGFCKSNTSTTIRVNSTSAGWTLGMFTNTAKGQLVTASGANRMFIPLKARVNAPGQPLQDLDGIGIDLLKNQASTGGIPRNVPVEYVLCSDIADVPGSYSVGVNILVVAGP